MELLRAHKLPFCISACCTSKNVDDVSSEAYFDKLIDAGGRRHLHLNARGDVEPCVFIHYSNGNNRDVSLLDALKSPLFMAYHDNQPFNGNVLRPCPMLEIPERPRVMVKEAGAKSTDCESPEDTDALCDRTVSYAENWKPKAEELWAASQAAKKQKGNHKEKPPAPGGFSCYVSAPGQAEPSANRARICASSFSSSENLSRNRLRSMRRLSLASIRRAV